MISERISRSSSNKDVFDKAAPHCSKELPNSGYKNTLYKTAQRIQQEQKQGRSRNITWFNPHTAWTSELTSKESSSAYLTHTSVGHKDSKKHSKGATSKSATATYQAYPISLWPTIKPLFPIKTTLTNETAVVGKRRYSLRR